MSTNRRDDDDGKIHGERASQLPAALELLSGAAAGAATGSIAGPVGAVTGAVIGGAIGAAAAVVLRRSDARAAAHDAELDADIGVIGGDLGNPVPPGTKLVTDDDERPTVNELPHSGDSEIG